jgi:DNA-3-methyladenine glycosylase I
MTEKTICSWVNLKNPLYIKYHNQEWGVPVKRDQKLFEMLILEGAQAGLSWETVLNKRAHYKKLFHGFNIQKCAELKDQELERFLLDPGIIRNKLKVYSVRTNALALLEVRKEFGSFSKYLWGFTEGVVVQNHWKSTKDIPAKTELSDIISKDMKKRGFKFIGSTIIYAYIQGIGMINDHSAKCYRYLELKD